MSELSLENVTEMLTQTKTASKYLRSLSTARKNSVLCKLADALQHHESEILAANAKDLHALSSVESPAFRDRLTVTQDRLSHMRKSLLAVAELQDPIGEIVETRTLPNGLLTRRIRSPLGILFMIFESRPNVALEAFSLAFKAGNAILLRGGKESKYTVSILYRLMKEALQTEGLSPHLVLGITSPERDLMHALLQQKKFIDVVVPRGGERLIEFVVEHSKIPIIKNDRGMCHLYVHEDANPEMAMRTLENAKKQRPGVCNAVETLLIHENCARSLLPKLHAKLSEGPRPVQWHLCEKSKVILDGAANLHPITQKSFDTEYLDDQLNCRIVSDLDQAIEHIETHGSHHSEAIITENEDFARKFQREVDAAAVYWNASTRFTDGFELGLGGELGISTQKLHVRGPVGLRELTSIRWVMDGTGQVRS